MGVRLFVLCVWFFAVRICLFIGKVCSIVVGLNMFVFVKLIFHYYLSFYWLSIHKALNLCPTFLAYNYLVLLLVIFISLQPLRRVHLFLIMNFVYVCPFVS